MLYRMNDLLTLREAASALGYTPLYLHKKLRLQRKRGIRIGTKFGNLWAFTNADLMKIKDATLPVGHPTTKGATPRRRSLPARVQHCH